MPIFLFTMGILVLVFGLFLGFVSNNLIIILLSIVGGLILLGISKIIEILEAISHKYLQIPFTLNQIWKIIKNSSQYEVASTTFEIHLSPKGDIIYPLVILDNEFYLRARVFYKYLSQSENEYKFELPKQEPVIITKSLSYYKGVELFDFRDQVFVKLKKINVKPIIEGKKLILEYFAEE